MTISEIIAALSLAVNVVRAVFDIAWKITMERKNAKKRLTANASPSNGQS